MEFINYNDGIYHYMDVNFEAGAEVDAYTLHALAELSTNVLKCVCVNQQPAVFKYGLNGVITLKRQLEIGLTFEKMMAILKAIASKMLSLADYLIDARQVYLSDETIFIDVLTGEVRLLIIPVCNGEPFPDIKVWLLAHLSTWRNEVYRRHYLEFYQYVNSNQFCIDGLIALVERLTAQNVTTNNPKSIEKEKSIKANKKYDEIIDRSFKQNRFKSILFLITIQCVFVLMYAYIYYKTPSYTGNVMTMRLGTLLIALGLDIYISQLAVKYMPDVVLNKINKTRPAFKTQLKAPRCEGRFETTLLARKKCAKSYLLDLASQQKHAVSGDRVLIGREAEKVDILLSSKTIGRRHCQIELSDEHYQIRDLSSKNGTYVNDQRLLQSAAQRLFNGDRIAVADQMLIFFEE